MNMSETGISVIVPFYNECETLPTFCRTLDEYSKNLSFPVELVFVNDGSSDNSNQIIKDYRFTNIKSARLVDLSKNFGSHTAVRAGVRNSNYDICTWVGADLQEPLEILDIAFQKIASDEVEIVYFSKKTVKVSKLNRLFSLIYSNLMRNYVSDAWSSEGTATIAFGKKVKDLLNANIESNSSVALQIMTMGFKYQNVSLDYNARFAGQSKWTLSKKIKLFIDSFVSFSYVPIRLVSTIGVLIFLIGLALAILTIVNRFINPDVQSGYTTLASILALGFGITNISLGIIAEYLWRTLDASRKRPVFIVSDVVELKSETKNKRE